LISPLDREGRLGEIVETKQAFDKVPALGAASVLPAIGLCHIASA
jgi:hypothetical protein